MTEQKTKPGDQDVTEYIQGLTDERARQDCAALVSLFREVTGEDPVLWGGSIIGFGQYHYKYASGHEGDSALTGFAPRKGNITLYLHGLYASGGFEGYADRMARLGKYKNGKGCLYIKRLSDVDPAVLRELVGLSVQTLKALYPPRG